MNEINFIFRLLKRIFIIGLLVGGGWLYFNDARVQATANQTAWNVRDRIAKLIGRDDTNSNDNSNLHLNDANNGSSKNEQGPTTEQQTSTQTSIPSTGRWATNQATVYVNTNKADIVVTTMNRSDSNAAGLTKTSSNSLTRRFMHATVYLNTYYLTDPSYGYSQERIVNTAEHELGHAIGLDHTNAVSVMQPAGSFYTIQPDDVQAVQKLYANNK